MKTQHESAPVRPTLPGPLQSHPASLCQRDHALRGRTPTTYRSLTGLSNRIMQWARDSFQMAITG